MRTILMRPAPMVALALSAIIGIVYVPWTGAQTPGSPGQYVASVKRNTTGGGTIRMMPSGLTVVGMPIRILIRQAYGPLQESQLVGGPGWIDSERFDIEVKPDGAASLPMPTLLRLVLEERFKLRVHTESRDLPIYELVPATNDGRLGPGLKPSEPDCVAMVEAAARGRGRGPDGRGAPSVDGRGADGRGRGVLPPQVQLQGPGPVGDRPPCGSRGGGFGRFRAGGTTLPQLAASLSGPVRRIVVDRTGLTGLFDVDLSFTPTPDQLPAGPPPPGAQLPAIDPDGPSLFTAVQEQLGLKLEPRRGPVDVVVIDAIEQPTEN